MCQVASYRQSYSSKAIAAAGVDDDDDVADVADGGVAVAAGVDARTSR